MDRRYNRLSLEERKILLDFIANHKDNIDAIVAQLTMTLGFKSKLYGARYIREAISFYYTMPEHTRGCLSDAVYPNVAKHFNTTASRVEKDIRTAISDTYVSGTLFRFNELVGVEFVSSLYSPTNSEFIACVVTWLQITVGAFN